MWGPLKRYYFQKGGPFGNLGDGHPGKDWGHDWVRVGDRWEGGGPEEEGQRDSGERNDIFQMIPPPVCITWVRQPGLEVELN